MMDAALIINGVVDTVARNASAADMPEHPEGEWVDAPAGEVFGGFTYDDEEFSAPEASVPTAEDVIAERERRLCLGFDFDFGDARGIHHIGTMPDDMRKWLDEVTPISQALLNVGQPDGEITIVTDTGVVTITATEWQMILLAAGQWRQPIYQASFALMAMDPIPADYADDVRWP